MKGNVNVIYELGKRDNQEDCLYPNVDNGFYLLNYFILCDGMGGHAQGEIASGTVCRVMSEWIGTNVKDRSVTEEDFQTALSAAYDELDTLDTDDSPKKMGTTLTFVSFSDSGVLAAHIGDSRIYHIRPSAESPVLYKTTDHSLVNDLFKIGEITEEEMATSKSRHILTRAVQPHQEYRSEADVRLLTDVQEGDYIYLCSDGMLENITDAELVEIFRASVSDDKKKQMLLDNSADNRDNHSAFIIRIGTESPVRKNVPVQSEKQPLEVPVIPNIKPKSQLAIPSGKKKWDYKLLYLLMLVLGFLMGWILIKFR